MMSLKSGTYFLMSPSRLMRREVGVSSTLMEKNSMILSEDSSDVSICTNRTYRGEGEGRGREGGEGEGRGREGGREERGKEEGNKHKHHCSTSTSKNLPSP